MLKDLKFAFCSAAITSASFSQAGAVGYGAVVAIAAALLSTLGRAIWRLLHQAGRDGSQFKFRDIPAARRGSEATFNPLQPFAAHRRCELARSNKTSTSQEHRHVET